MAFLTNHIGYATIHVLTPLPEGHPASDFAYSSHQHDAGDIISGAIDISLIPAHIHPEYATTGMLASHTHSGYADSTHTHDGGAIATGIVGYARLPVGPGLGQIADGLHTHNHSDLLGTVDAYLLNGLQASDYSLSSHSHQKLRYLSGVIKFPPSIFTYSSASNSTPGWHAEPFGLYVNYSSPQNDYNKAPLYMPFPCVIDFIEFRVRDRRTDGRTEIILEKYDETTIYNLGTVATTDGENPGHTTLTMALGLPYDPSDNNLYWIKVGFFSNSSSAQGVNDQRLTWIKVYYSLL